MPAPGFPERAADQRRQQGTDIDSDVKDRVGEVAPLVAGCVKAADLGHDIGLEGAVGEDEGGERDEEEVLERHHEMPGRHQGGADDHGAALAEHPVGDQAADERGGVNEGGIEAVDIRREGLRPERPEHAFQHAAQRVEPDDPVGAAGDEQILGHVEDEQRAHPVIGEALPHLGGEQEREAARMTEQIPERLGMVDLVGA